MRKFFIFLLILSALKGEYIVQKTWKDGYGIFYTSTWTGFWRAENIDYFYDKGVRLLENGFFMFRPRNLMGDYGTVAKIASLNPDTVFIAVNSPEGAKIFYTLFYKGFSSNQYFSVGRGIKDIVKFLGFIWLGTQDSIYFINLFQFPSNPTFHSLLYEFRNFTVWQDNLYAIQGGGYRYVLRYDGNAWEQVYRFNGEEVNDLIWIFSDSLKGIFILGKKDSVWRVYNSPNGYPPFYRIPSPPDSIGYAVKGISDCEKLFILVKSPSALFVYSFSDSVWKKVLEGDEYTTFEDIVKGKGGILYILARRTSSPQNLIFSSYDGENFYISDTLDVSLEGLSANTLSYIGDGHVLLGTQNDPEILYSVFSKRAVLTSSTLNCKREGSYPVYKKFLLFFEGGEVKVKLRTFSDSLFPDTIPWDSLPYLQDSLIENYEGIIQGNKYFQYRVEIIPFSQLYAFILDSLKLMVEYDSTGPSLTSAMADDGVWEKNGKDPDDRVILVFDEPTEKPEINKSNVDSIFPLSNGHSWLNIYGYFGGAEWNEKGDTLEIFLAYTGNQYPSVMPGDTVYAKIRDRFGFYRESWTIIGGSFDDIKGPRLKRCIASDGNIKENGIDEDDFLIMVFSEPTNMPDFDTIDINLVFALSKGHTFGDSVNAQWVTPDSLVINLIPSANPTLWNGDTVYPSPLYLKDSLGNSAEGWGIIEGSFDEKVPHCDSVILYENNFRDTLLDRDDFVVFYFSEPLIMEIPIDSLNIDHALKLSQNHSWLSGSGKLGEMIFNNDILIIFFNFENGAPSLNPYDTVYINPVYFSDYGGNSLGDTVVIKYSWIMEPLKESQSGLHAFQILNIPFEKSLFFKNDMQNLEISIYDVAGRCLESIKLKYIKGGKRILFKNLKKGVYFIKVKAQDKEVGIFKKVLVK